MDRMDRDLLKKKYQLIKNIAGDKPIAIGECSSLPDAKILHEQPRWVFFMGWAEEVFKKNLSPEIKKIYNSRYVLTLSEVKRRSY